jgi:hypothetical protein
MKVSLEDARFVPVSISDIKDVPTEITGAGPV